MICRYTSASMLGFYTYRAFQSYTKSLAPGWRSQPPSPWWGGGGQNDPPPLTRKLEKLEGRAIRRSTALSEPVRSHFGQFFAQVKIEVSRGHQKSNFRKMMVLSGMPAIISGTTSLRTTSLTSVTSVTSCVNESVS